MNASSTEPVVEVNTPVDSPRHVKVVLPDTIQFDEWLEARRRFMIKKGWKTGEVDLDEYDARDNTEHLVLYDNNEKIVLGMRITPVNSYKESLSWEMVAGTSIESQVLSSGAIDEGQFVWDITRLVPGDNGPSRESLDAMPKLFGEGLRYCQMQGDDDPTWIFVMDSPLVRWLAREGVSIDALGQATLEGDRVPSVFGAYKPAELAARWRENSFADRAKADGVE